MNTKILIGVVAVVVIAAGFWYIQGTSAPAASVEDSGEFSGTGSIAALVARGEDHECTVALPSSTYQGALTVGTIKMSGGKLYGSFQIDIDDKIQHAQVIHDGVMEYAWLDSNPRGPQGVEMPATSPHSGYMYAIDIKKETATYSCHSWIADASVFIPPSTVSFAQDQGY